MSTAILNENLVFRLVNDALPMFYAAGENYQAKAVSGAAMVVSGEPVADLNYIVVTEGSDRAANAFSDYVNWCDENHLPFASMIASAACGRMEPLRKELGLVYAADWPLMICGADRAEEFPQPGVAIRAQNGESDWKSASDVLASSFSMPVDSVRRAMPLALTDSPSIDIFVAERDGDVLSTVTVTWHGEVAGVWAMGTSEEAQGQGIGKALLSRVMCDSRERGVREFFLGATPSGLPLYEKLGYETLTSAQVWVRGESHQV